MHVPQAIPRHLIAHAIFLDFILFWGSHLTLQSSAPSLYALHAPAPWLPQLGGCTPPRQLPGQLPNFRARGEEPPSLLSCCSAAGSRGRGLLPLAAPLLEYVSDKGSSDEENVAADHGLCREGRAARASGRVRMPLQAELRHSCSFGKKIGAGMTVPRGGDQPCMQPLGSRTWRSIMAPQNPRAPSQE